MTLNRPPAAFPAARGRTLDTLRDRLPAGPILAPSTATLEVGRNRFGFALFTPDRKQLTTARVALYTSDHDGSNVRGPYVARLESMKIKPQYESKTTAADPDGAKSVYVATIPIAAAGRRIITGIASIGGRMVRTSAFELRATRRSAPGAPPDVGDKPPAIHTETLDSVAGDASKISTRIPPAEDLLQTDYADVVGKKPVVITFATPLLCQSRVCGPVVDVVEQVRAQTKANVAFIHQEIYNDNRADRGFRPQVTAWHLPTEPWTFVLDRRGRVASRFEGALSPRELAEAVDRVSRSA